jgi:hypothetical protein
MKANKKLVNELIKSLTTEVDNWEFGNYTAINSDWGISIWIANVPIFDLEVYEPTKVCFSIWDRIRIYKALSECRALKIIKIKTK